MADFQYIVSKDNKYRQLRDSLENGKGNNNKKRKSIEERKSKRK